MFSHVPAMIIRGNGACPPGDRWQQWTITKSNPLCLLMECEPFVHMSYLPLSEQDVLSSIQIIAGTWENIGLSFIFQRETSLNNSSIPWDERLDTTINVSNMYWLLTDLDTNTYVTDCKLWILQCVQNSSFITSSNENWVVGCWTFVVICVSIHRYREHDEFVNNVFEQSTLHRKG